jgi:hydrogenase maturation factor
MESRTYPIGKLPKVDLVHLLTQFVDADDPRVIQGPGLGCDAAVIDFGDHYLVAKSDPITFATDEIGWYVVNINANDIACVGARPRWFIATLLLPEQKTDKALTKQIFQQLNAACQSLGAILIGGHTEITHGLTRPIVAGAMFGEVSPGQLIRSDGAQPGDALILTKGIAVEGTALLAREMNHRPIKAVSPPHLHRAVQFLHDPGISVVRDAMIITSAGEVHAMHDPTEGGIATGIYELTEAAGVGATLDEAALPIYPETRMLCEAYNLNPLGLLASGSLLAAVAPQDAAEIIQHLQAADIKATVIGEIRETPGVVLLSNIGERPLPEFERDEIARLFDPVT